MPRRCSDAAGACRRRGSRRCGFPSRCPAGAAGLSLPNPIPFPGARVALGDDGRVNVSALRDLTDDSGGRTEIIRDPRDLEPATAGVADELSRQYFLGYVAPGHDDGRWHTIEVEVSDPRLRVRARRGYVASP